MFAIFLYEHKKISLSKACEIGGMSQWEFFEQGHSAANSKKEEHRQETGTAGQYESSTISNRKGFFLAEKKVPPSGSPMGKTAKMF